MADYKEDKNNIILKKILKKLDLRFPVAEIHRSTGFGKGNVSSYINDKKPVSDNFIKTLLKEYNLLKDDFTEGGQKQYPQQISEPSMVGEPNAIEVDFRQMDVMFVPLVSKYAYGGFLDNYGDDEYFEDLPKIPFANDKEHKGSYLCFEVKGDSMDDGSYRSYLEGDVLLCRILNQEHWVNSRLHLHRWTKFVIVHRTRGVLVKEILKHDVEKGIITIHSLNDYYEDEELKLKNVSMLLNVVDMRRKEIRR